MGKKSNIIEINGTKYDARTGAALSNKVVGQPAKIQSAVKTPTMSDVVRKSARHTAAHKPHPSQTLMRSAVKKPGTASRKHSKAQGYIDAVAPASKAAVLSKKSVNRIDDKRLVKARRVPQSKLIQHFSAVTSDVNQVPVQNLAAATLASPVQPLPKPAQPAAKATAKPRTTAELLDHALKHATSHEQAAPPKKSRKGLKIAAGLAVAALLVGVAVLQQMPNIRMHMAAAKAGFSASMPDYRPAGYSLGKLDAGSGVVTTTFDSNNDDRQYTLIQKASNWDSQALRDNFVVQHDKDYKVYTDAGRTIYVYGDHDASWVNGGVWYIVQSNGSLGDEQLVELASSL